MIVMNYDLILTTILIFFVGKLILRLGGRKSLAQMTMTEAIVTLSLGTILVQPITSKDPLTTFLVIFLFVGLAIISEYLEMKFDFIETLFIGKSIIVVEKGKIKIENLKKLRMSIDKLEIRLRQAGISSIDDIEYATIEPSGKLGYELKDNKKPLTKEDFIEFLSNLTEFNGRQSSVKKKTRSKKKGDLFKEIKDKTTEGNKNEP